MTPDVLASGLMFPESARWHDGRLWLSDMLAGRVLQCDVATGAVTEVLAIDDRVSGLGWLPDGSLVVSCMLSRTVRRRTEEGDVQVLADLSAITPWPINDLVTDGSGTTYLGGFGFDFYSGAPPQTSELYRVRADGAVDVVASDLNFPNGSVILPGTSTLVVAETWAGQLAAFDVDDTGGLRNHRVWARLPEGCTPDGICVDLEHGIWVSSFLTGEFLRVDAGGAVTQRIDVGDRWAIDCALGGPAGTSLFMFTAERREPSGPDDGSGRIETVEVSVPGPIA